MAVIEVMAVMIHDANREDGFIDIVTCFFDEHRGLYSSSYWNN